MTDRNPRLLGVIAAAAIALLGAAPVHGPVAAEIDATVAPEDQRARELARVETYLNSIGSMRADFIQLAPNGAISDGKVYLDRPGFVRFEYNPPSKLLVIGRGKWISLIDYEVGQVSRWPISDTPFRVLVEADIKFGKDIDIASVNRTTGLLGVTFFDADDPKQGSIQLIFTRFPLELRQWIVTDPRGQATRVSLTNIQMNVEVDPELFEFDDPRPLRRRRRR